MNVVRGSVVISLSGRDRGGLFVAQDVSDRCVYIADGKGRKLDNPKRKNVKHISPAGPTLCMTDMTDKKLRKTLRALATRSAELKAAETEKGEK